MDNQLRRLVFDLRTCESVPNFPSPDTLFPSHISLQELDRGPPRCGSHEALRALRPFDCSVTTRYSVRPVHGRPHHNLTASRPQPNKPSVSRLGPSPLSFSCYETFASRTSLSTSARHVQIQERQGGLRLSSSYTEDHKRFVTGDGERGSLVAETT